MPRTHPTRRPRATLASVPVALVALVVALGALPAAGRPDAPATPARLPRAEAPGFDQPGIPVRPASERYVRDTYATLLGRSVDEAGLAYWGDRLDQSDDRATFARLLVLSPEALRRQLQQLWADVSWEPTSQEVDADVEALRTGVVTLEGVQVRLLASNAFYQDAGGTPEGYVAALYQAVLDRAGDPAGAAYWTGRLEAGAARTAVAQGFVLSPDRRRAVVAAAYDLVLGRVPDDAGRDYWVDRLGRGLGQLRLLRSLLASDEAWALGCGVLGQGRCLLPFPNDAMTMPDPTTDTGRRVVLKPPWVPAPVGGPAFDPTEWNRQDGFSPGSALLVAGAGIDPARSGLAPLTDIGASLDPDAPLAVVEVATGERWPYWVEVDSNAAPGPDQALVIRPARNFRDGHTYAVGIGPLRDAAGQAIAAPAAFRTLRDGLPSANRLLNDQREATEAAITAVTDAGMERDTLHLAWTFTVASTRNLAERIVHMRDEALAGPAGSGAGGFTVTAVTPQPGTQTTRVEGTFTVPSYLTGSGAPGSRLHLGPDHLPEPNGTFTASFVCTVPDSARTTAARPVLYGHGLLGSPGEANSTYARAMGREHNMVYCGTPWVGMSEEDIATTITIVSDLSRFPQLADRTQQAFLNFMVLGRLLTSPTGFATHTAFQGEGGAPVTGTQLFFDGISQGGIMGGALAAVSPDITRAALGVPAMNYSTLLERSVDFVPFALFMHPAYPSALDRILLISVVQMLWDRGEANGYANHLTADPLPGTPAADVLLHIAFGDHQVSQYAADVEARTIGAATNDPPLAAGRLPGFVEPLWGIDRIEGYPHAGSAIVYWDDGTPAPPIENLPNEAGTDPHGRPRQDPDARAQIDAFLQPDGVVVDVCAGSPCVADGT